MTEPQSEDARAPEVVFVCGFPPPPTGVRVASARYADLLRPTCALAEVPIETPHTAHRGPVAAGRRLRAHARALRRARRLLRRADAPAVYFCPSGSRFGLLRDVALVLALRRRAGRLVAHVHNGRYEGFWDAPDTRPLAEWLLRQVDVLIVSGHAQAAALRAQLAPTDVRVVPNPPDPELLEADAASLRADPEAPGPLRVLYCSHFIPSKGYGDVLEGVAQASGEVRATFVGEWPSAGARQAFLVRVEALGLTETVRLLPLANDRHQVLELLLAHDVIALPTYYPNESQPLAVVEGMAAGCVPLVTAHASLPEFITDGASGVVVPPRDPAAIAAALDRLTDRTVLAALARRAQAVVRGAFAPEHALEMLRDALLGPLPRP